MEFFDIGAMVFFLRKVIWTVPDFIVDRYHSRLQDMHDQVARDGSFHSTTSRTLFELRKPIHRKEITHRLPHTPGARNNHLTAS